MPPKPATTHTQTLWVMLPDRLRLTDNKIQEGLMFKRINDKINLSFETEVTKGMDDIMTSLKEKAKGHKWYSFLIPGQIDYKEFKFLDNEIEIRRMPNTFW